MSESQYTAEGIAAFFLANVDKEAGDNISNLKLQKLLYYAQGLHVAMHDGERLFPEPIVAWDHGPVVSSVYHLYKNYGWQGIAPPDPFDPSEYPPEVREFLGVVYEVYGQYTAKRLEAMTHDEPPWQDTPRNEEVPVDLMRSFFSSVVEAGREGKSVGGEPAWPTNSFRFQKRKAISRAMARHRGRLGDIARHASQDNDPWADD